MARVFVSHAGADLTLASKVHGWLVDAGHEVFLDRHPQDGMAVGERWEQRLYERLRWADAVVCVVTSAYLASPWCTAEVGAAHARGSRLLPLLAEPGVVHPLLASTEYTDYTVDSAEARAALVETLRRVDLGWPPDRSPFPGLRPFEADRHRVFFGRTQEIGQLAELLRSPAEHAERAALVVVGPSGCGKSSLVRAGLLPVLGDEPGWRALPPILPGTDPVTALARELAAAARRVGLDWTVEHVCHQLDQRRLTGLADELLLADPAGPQQRLLIVIDQFEELLTQTPPAQRTRFAELLCSALTGPVRVVATLRPEFLDPLLLDPDLAAFSTRPYTLRPLRREALRAVIEKPAQLAGIEVDDGLVDRLVDDTDTGEALPLLAFTLAQLTDGITHGGKLSSTRYDQLGGVRGALTRQADAALAEAITAGGRTHEQVIAGLLRLVTVDEQGRPTRWRVNRAELPDHVFTELNAFVTRRLLTTDSDNGTVVIGVAHEAFLSAWPPLAQAITQNVSALRARRAVEHAATEWHDNARPPARLWTGGQLAAAVTDTGARLRTGKAPASTPPKRGTSRRLPRRHRELVTDHVNLSAKARDFIRASIRRDRYRRRRTTTVLSILLVLAVAAAGVAVYQQDKAEARQLVATARQLVAQAELTRNTDLRIALKLGLAAHRIHPNGETHASLVNTLTSTHYANTLTGHTGPVYSVAFAPEGRTLATGSDDGTVILWSLTDPARPRQLGAPLNGHAGSVYSVAFASDGRTLATGSDDGTVILWDLTDPAQPRQLGSPLTGHTGPMFPVVFAPDGRTLATGSDDGTVILWDVTDPAQPRQLGSPPTGHTGPMFSMVFAPEGRTLATGSDDGTVILWDATDPGKLRQLGSPLTGHTGSVFSMAFTSDGRTLVTGSDDRTMILWNVTDPAQPRQLGSPLTGHTGSVFSVVFASDGRTLVTGSDDRTVILWDVTDPAQPRRLGSPLTGHTDYVNAVAFAPDGRTLATGSDDGTVILWDASDPAQPRRLGSPLTGHTGPVYSVAFAAGTHILATGSYDGTVILWDASDPAQPRQLGSPLTGHTGPVNAVAFACDGRTLATGSNDRTVILWDATDPAQPRQLGSPLTGHTGPVYSVAFAAGTHILATGSKDRTVILWDASDPAQPRQFGTPLNGHVGYVDSMALTPDGHILATGSNDGTVILWDLIDPTQPGRLGTPLTGHTASVLSVTFAPTGHTLATGSNDRTVVLWDFTDLNYLVDHAVERACFIARGGLDRDEWIRRMPGLPYQETCPA